MSKRAIIGLVCIAPMCGLVAFSMAKAVLEMGWVALLIVGCAILFCIGVAFLGIFDRTPWDF